MMTLGSAVSSVRIIAGQKYQIGQPSISSATFRFHHLGHNAVSLAFQYELITPLGCGDIVNIVNGRIRVFVSEITGSYS